MRTKEEIKEKLTELEALSDELLVTTHQFSSIRGMITSLKWVLECENT